MKTVDIGTFAIAGVAAAWMFSPDRGEVTDAQERDGEAAQ